jgi:hypothetical protein
MSCDKIYQITLRLIKLRIQKNTLLLTFFRATLDDLGLSNHRFANHNYKASKYKDEALRLWPQRCNTAKRTRCYKFPTIHAAVVVAVPSTVQYPTNYKIKHIV